MSSNQTETDHEETPRLAWERYQAMSLDLYRVAELRERDGEPYLASALHDAANALQRAADYLFDVEQAPQPRHSYVDDYHV